MSNDEAFLLGGKTELKDFLQSRYSVECEGEVLDYCSSILKDVGEDLNSGEEVYDALGEILSEILPASVDEEAIGGLCSELYGLCVGEEALANGESGSSNRGGHAVLQLDAPICIGEALQAQNGTEEAACDWKNETARQIVDPKKLEKAEKQLLKKQSKAASQGTPQQSSSNDGSSTATASQRINKSRTEGSGCKDIRLEGVDVAFGDKVLIQNTDVNLVFGRRYGLVGRNGLGKSTFLRMLSSSQLQIPPHISILHVEQEVTGDSTTALNSVLQSDTLRTSLLASAKDPTTPNLPEIYAQLESIESDKAPSRASTILSGLGFTPAMQSRATQTFSGGWRMRLALARALFLKPDLLLLDEPTNMLDMEAILWLEKYLLKKWPSTLLVVSHNSSFLDQVCTDMLHLHSQRLDMYRGSNYTEFICSMRERMKAQRREYEAQMEHRKHVQEFIDKFRFNAKRASLVQSRIKALERLPVLVPVEKETEVVLTFPPVEKLSPPILVLDGVGFSYGDKDKMVFQNVDLSATLESRICIVGKNGSGKTTLLKLIMEEVTETAGRRMVHRGLKFGYFSQHHVDQIDMNISPLETMVKKFPDKKTEECRRLLGHFGISGDLALQKTQSLSGGQKSRVAFAIICADQPNFLILDEPTNHLDIETIDALGQALLRYKGGMILVCHDEKLIRMVCQELWICANGSVKMLEGGFDAYRRVIENEMEF